MNELKKMFLGLTASTVVLTSFVLALPSRAQEVISEEGTEQTVALHEGGDAGGPEECGPWAEKMGLSDEQMEKLVSLKSAYVVKTAAQKAELMADMKKLLLLMTEEKVDRQAVTSLHEDMGTLKSNLAKARLDHMLDVMEVMTPKQRSEMRHRMLVHMSSPHQMGGGHHHHMMHHHE